MLTRTPLVAGNWKMNGDPALVDATAGALRQVAADIACRVVVCPPAVFIPSLASSLAGSNILVGAQNVSEHRGGAYTGEISAEMLVRAGASYVIIGHSERRSLFGETSDDVARKMARALDAGLIPVVCVGETLDERQGGLTEQVLTRQLSPILALESPLWRRCIIAYEPVWAIGTGVTASPGQAQATHAFIRAVLAAQDAGAAEALCILYGGSVKASNASELFACADIDGGLIGGASLNPEEFVSICRSASIKGN